MTRTSFTALLMCCLLPVGCARVQTASVPADQNISQTPQAAVMRGVPAVQRTVTQNDLANLQRYMEFARAESGNYPKTLAELPSDVKRDLPKLYQAIEAGDIVLVGNPGGVLAYETSALTDRGSVLTTQGIQVMTPDELRPLLGSGD